MTLFALWFAAAPLTAWGNEPPEVDAGPSAVVCLPDDATSLTGTASDDDGSIVSWEWTKLSGPSVTMRDADTPTLLLSDLTEGRYRFRLKVRDDDGASRSDETYCFTHDNENDGDLSGERKRWHRVTADFTGPDLKEWEGPDPFLDHRLEVWFVHVSSGATYRVPGFFAADGDAQNTSTARGDQWRVRFSPDRTGEWMYWASFRTGTDLSIELDADAGTSASFDGASGTFWVAETDKTGRDFRAHGRIGWVGERYLRHQGSGKWFLKFGANSPENFLAYYEFDNTIDTHRYNPHRSDYDNYGRGNLWGGGKGERILGVINYLAHRDMNTMYFLTMNVAGDGDDVWPWRESNKRRDYDVSKLAQWEMVFDHMDRMGICLHVVTQETENDQLLDSGDLGRERKLYYRELIARFGHHLGLVWNLGEEITNTPEQIADFYDYFRALDADGHPIIAHTEPSKQEEKLGPLLDSGRLEGVSMQVFHPDDVSRDITEWVDETRSRGKRWSVSMDEIGPGSRGARPDSVNYWHDDMRVDVMWNSLVRGSTGIEWYFGSGYEHDDLDCEDLRSRDHLFRMTSYALGFFEEHVPYATSEPERWRLNGSGAVLVDHDAFGEPTTMVVHLPDGSNSQPVDLGSTSRTFDIWWFDPKVGGDLQRGTVDEVQGPGFQGIGRAPKETDRDWVALLKATNVPPDITSFTVSPDPIDLPDDLTFTARVDDPDGLLDVQSVLVTVRDPQGRFLGQFPLTQNGGSDTWGVTFPQVDGIPKGTWTFHAKAKDLAGERDIFGPVSLEVR